MLIKLHLVLINDKRIESIHTEQAKGSYINLYNNLDYVIENKKELDRNWPQILLIHPEY